MDSLFAYPQIFIVYFVMGSKWKIQFFMEPKVINVRQTFMIEADGLPTSAKVELLKRRMA